MAYGTTLTFPTLVGSHINFVITLKESDFPEKAIDGGENSILNGGGNLRAYTRSQLYKRDTPIPIDIEIFEVGANPKILVHIRVPNASTGTQIYLEASVKHTDQPAVSEPTGRNAVWSDYYAVWHLGEQPSLAVGNYVDSTGNGHDATATTIYDRVETILGYGTERSSGSILELPFMVDNNDSFVYQAYFKTPFWQTRGVGYQDDTSSRLMMCYKDSDSLLYTYGNFEEIVPHGIVSNSMNKFELVFDKSDNTVDCYFNGEFKVSGSGVTNAGTTIDSIGMFGAAARVGAVNSFQGIGDEVRIRKIPVTQDWVTDEHLNQIQVNGWATNDGWIGETPFHNFHPDAIINLEDDVTVLEIPNNKVGANMFERFLGNTQAGKFTLRLNSKAINMDEVNSVVYESKVGDNCLQIVCELNLDEPEQGNFLVPFSESDYPAPGRYPYSITVNFKTGEITTFAKSVVTIKGKACD